MKILYNILFLFLTVFFIRCTTNKQVDLIVFNAKIYTVDSVFSQREAFAVKGGIFVDMGTSKDIMGKYTAKEVIDADGKAIYPGFYDAHAHFLMLAELMEQVDLNGSTSYQEVIKRLQVYHQENPNKKWIVGGGWDQNLWEDKSFPSKDSLDKYFPETPVFLSRVDYHTALVNSRALHIAQLDSSRAVVGGLMAIDSLGHLTGILIDNAMELVSR